MNLETFLVRQEPVWRELDDLVERARGKPERLEPARISRLGDLYRATAADFAYARRRWAGDPVVAALAARVGRARQVVYDTEPRRRGVVEFMTCTYWRRVAERPVPLLVAATFLIVPTLFGIVWARHDPAGALGIVPSAFRNAKSGPSSRSGSLGIPFGQQAAFASQIFTNNIRVTFVAFAGGILAGLGTMAALAQNGLLLGVLGGISFQVGIGGRFVELVAAHGVLELSCIVVAGAAGLRFGWSMIDPGRRRRGDALVEEGRGAIEIILGTAPWLVVAGLVEGFVTPRGIGTAAALAFGLVLGGIYWTLVLTRGRARRLETEPQL